MSSRRSSRLRRGGPEGRITGLEIGSHAVKAVCLRRAGGRVELHGWAAHRLRREAGPAARAAVAAAGGGGAPVILLLQGPGVAFRTLRLPPMGRRELARAVRWQAGQLGGKPLEELAWACRTLGPDPAMERAELRVQLAVAPRELIEGHRRTLRDAGLALAAMTVTPLAYESLLGWFGWLEPGIPLAVADLGARRGTVALLLGERCEFAREFVAAGDLVTASLTDDLEDILSFAGASGSAADEERTAISRAQAERAKREYGLLPGAGEAPQFSAASPGLAAALIRPAVDRIAQEVRRSLEFAVRESGASRPKRLALAGGTAKLPYLAEHLAARTRTSARLFAAPDAFTAELPPRRRAAFRARTPELAAALGLALCDRGVLDLARTPSRSGTWIRRPRVATASAATVLGLLALVWCLGPARAPRSPATAAPAPGALPVLSATPPRGAGGISPWCWKALGVAGRPAVELESVELDGFPPGEAAPFLRVAGLARAAGPGADLELLEFLLAVERLPFFGRPVLETRARESGDAQSLIRFTLSCPLESAALANASTGPALARGGETGIARRLAELAGSCGLRVTRLEVPPEQLFAASAGTGAEGAAERWIRIRLATRGGYRAHGSFLEGLARSGLPCRVEGVQAGAGAEEGGLEATTVIGVRFLGSPSS